MNVKVPYVSVIKINGKPILPPIITPELRRELLIYKQQAIRLEQRLKNCRELKRNLDELFDCQSRPLSQLTFNDNSHLDALDISDRPRLLKHIQLSKDLIEVTEYNENGLKTICSNVQLEDDTLEPSSEVICDRDVKNIFVQTSENGVKTPVNKPRLIRSNSYTLESPSPILLEHLKKNTRTLSDSRNWTSLENNHESFDSSSDFSSISTVFHKSADEKQEVNDLIETHKSIDEKREIDDSIKTPTIEVYQTDISVQQITVNTNIGDANGANKERRQEAFFSKNPLGVLEPDSKLLNVLKDVPDAYAEQIIRLLKKQFSEHKERLERYDDLNDNTECLENSFQNKEQIYSPPTNLTSSTQCPESDLDKLVNQAQDNATNSKKVENNTNYSSQPQADRLRRSSTFSVSPSQSLYYSLSSDSDTLARMTPFRDDCVEDGGKMEIGVLREKNGYWEGVLRHDNNEKLSCSKKLFSPDDTALKQEWAASIIGAHVRGYLTRRLIKTERVQILIATIKDVLTCALELHHSDDIDEKDVELHRRLINQLSAALYSFHDIFFDLSIPEQMLLIGADRQRKLEKHKRPQSGRNSVRSQKSLNSNQSVVLT